jgi:hypothetical protein
MASPVRGPALGAAVGAAARGRDTRRVLQLALATTWLLDGVLQLQPTFFARSFGAQMITGMAAGLPRPVARPIVLSGQFIGHHAVAMNTVFALLQLLVGLGIAWRPTVKWALAVSVVWSMGVWWIGEGLGGTLSGGASVLAGAPGAVLIYAILAVVLWPTDQPGEAPLSVAASAIGAKAAGLVWSVFWGALALLSLVGANRSPRGIQHLVAAMASGEPGWLAAVNREVAGLAAQRGLVVSVLLAGLLVLVAVGVHLPAPVPRAAVVVAISIAVVSWVVAEDLGTLLAGGATDPNSGPLLVLLAMAYWPCRVGAPATPTPTATDVPGASGGVPPGAMTAGGD